MIANVAEGDAEDINRAVAAARKAFDEGPWPKMTAYVTTPCLFLISFDQWTIIGLVQGQWFYFFFSNNLCQYLHRKGQKYSCASLI